MVVHRIDNRHGLPALTVTSNPRLVGCLECRLWDALPVDVAARLREAPVQGPERAR